MWANVGVSTQCPSGTMSDDGWGAAARACVPCSAGLSSSPGAVACAAKAARGGRNTGIVVGIVVGVIGGVLVASLATVAWMRRFQARRQVHTGGPDGAVPVDVRRLPLNLHLPAEVLDWNVDHVRTWLQSQDVCVSIVGSLGAVNGKDLHSLYYAVERRDERCLAAMALYGGPEDWGRLQQVWKACRHLEICVWSKREWVRDWSPHFKM